MGNNIASHATIALRPPSPKPQKISPGKGETRPCGSARPTKKSSNASSTPRRGAKVTLNISGCRYMTYVTTLDRFPTTLLGNAEKRIHYYDEDLGEYFFDRNKQVFELILYFYQSNGRLVCPPELSPEILLEEVEFFELGDDAVEAVKDIVSEDDEPGEENKREMPDRKLQRQIWNLFEYPDSGLAARVLALLSVTVIVASIVVLCIETMPEFEIIPPPVSNDTKEAESIRNHNEIAKTARSWFSDLEIAFITWFTFEYLVRLCSSPRKLAFARSFLNVIDLLAILPFYVEVALEYSISADQNFSLAFLRILRLVRVFRIFKLSRHSSGLQILGMTLRKSLRELGLLIFFLAIGVVIFSAMVYYAESGNEDTFFVSIPHAFWWALVTMTTVGYGDMYPKNLWGKLVGSCCALCGVLAIALPVPVIVSNFDLIYKKFRSKKLKQEARQLEGEKRKLSVMVSVDRRDSRLSSKLYESPTFERKLSKSDPDSLSSVTDVRENGGANNVWQKSDALGKKRLRVANRNSFPDGNGNVANRSYDAVEWFPLIEGNPDAEAPVKTHGSTLV